MSKADLLKAYNEARDQYTKKMQLACSPDSPSMTQENIIHTHRLEMEAAGKTFLAKAKVLAAEPKTIEQNLTKLTEELNNHQKEYFDLNQVKTTKTVAKAKNAFDKAVESVTLGKPLCVNRLDVEGVHAEAMQTAQKVFNADRIKSFGLDWDLHYLIDYLQLNNNMMRLLNTKNNMLFGYEFALKYFQDMLSKCIRGRLSIEEFNAEHEKARVIALERFFSKRNRNRFTDDTLKFKVEQYITIQYSQLKQFNASTTNRVVFQQSVSLYDRSAYSPSALWQHCFHPEDLKKNHEDVLCQALRAFRANRACSAGFKDSEKEELDLHLVLENRYRTLADINSIANQVAEEVGFLEFRITFNTLVNLNGNGWFSMKQDKRRSCYDKAIVVGLDAFYGKRRDKKQHAADSYKDELLARCQGYAQVHL